MTEFREDKAYIKERNKSAEDRAEDVAYTINHAIACSITDFIDPFVGKWVQDKIGYKISIGCGHDHSNDNGHTHDHTHEHEHDHEHGHSHASEFKPYGSIGHSILGEVIGDFGSVPVAVLAQRFAPDFMASMRDLMEPVVGAAFHKSAEKSAMRWAFKRGIAYNSEEYNQRLDDTYNHEMDHLPQAVVWTLASVGINTGAQRFFGNTHSPVTIAGGKAIGSLLTTGMVLGSRAAFPKKAREWDQYTSKNLFVPATKVVGKAFGISSEVVDKIVAHEDGVREGTWEDRIRHSSPADITPPAI